MADRDSKVSRVEFPIVAVGASAGGVEALKLFVENIPKKTGCAFVVLQHLAPDHESQLTSILARSSKLPVKEATVDMPIEIDHIYVLPPDRYLRIVDHGLFVEQPSEPRGQRMAIDYFARSLAEAHKSNAIGVILSGTGSDGAIGMREVQSHGGLTLAQAPETALYDGMPQAAIEMGAVDIVGSIDEIVSEIVKFASKPNRPEDNKGGLSDQDMKTLIATLKARVGHDFSSYKPGTIGRRVKRRMSLLRFDSFADYLKHLRNSNAEPQQLFRDLLINVTGFFRDPKVWPKIRKEVIEPLVASANGETIRVWVPACSTGEEAYSLAMLFDEVCTETSVKCRWQIFATDVDQEAVAKAREGLYPNGIENDISKTRLKKFFRREAAGFRVEKAIRERVVFAPHNLIGDPPFSRLHLISCRNVLIYFSNGMQSRVLDLFHFALVDGGYLVLGTSETTSQGPRLYKAISSKDHIYRKLKGPAGRKIPTTEGSSASRLAAPLRGPGDDGKETHSLAAVVRQTLLDRFSPASIVASADGHVQYFHGGVRKFLQVPEGSPTQNLFEMLHPSLRIRIRELIRQATDNNSASNVVTASLPDGDREVQIDCVDIGDKVGEQQFLISLVELRTPDPIDTRVRTDDGYARQLENELSLVKEDLQSTIEELETSNEELQASNEESMAANEELQSTNEELETSREELQSLNEELVTVNSQLEEKLDELEKVTADLNNLFESTTLPVVFLDNELRIRKFTPAVAKVIEVREGDEGRRVNSLASRTDDSCLVEDAQWVLEQLTPISRHVASNDGRIYDRRVQPYRTSDSRIAGVVVTFSDISDLATTAQKLKTRENQQSALAEMGQIALSIKDEQALLDEVVDKLSETFGADAIKILELRDDNKEFLLKSGRGWHKAKVGKATVPNSLDSQAGYTLKAEEPVLVQDLKTERRFRGPKLLEDHDIRSGISTIIMVEGRPWGVLGIHCKKPDAFNQEDVNLARSSANILSAALTNQRREDELASERLTLRLAVSASRLAVWHWDTSTDQSAWDDRLFRMLGLPNDGRAHGDRFFAALHPDDQDRVREELSSCINGRLPFRSEFRVPLKHGGVRWLAARGAVIPGTNPPVMTGVNYDITDSKRAEEDYQLIIRELDHRVKNMLAIILSITRLSIREGDTIESFLERFDLRLHAMARTQSLLSAARWKGLTLYNLLEQELRQYESDGKDNILISGPDIVLDSQTGQAISMAFHELATNAAKYGALSVPEGRVIVRWSVKSNADVQRLSLIWKEENGPKVVEPSDPGFGSKVLNRILARQLRADVKQDFQIDGLRFEMNMPYEGTPSGDGIATRNDDTSDLSEADLSILEKKRILVLDDEWLIAEQHCNALKDAKADVLGPFLSIDEAKKGKGRKKIDLAVLDFNIGGDPVTPFAEALVEGGVPVIIVTGYGSNMSLSEKLETVTVVRKPAPSKMLVSVAAQVLSENE